VSVLAEAGAASPAASAAVASTVARDFFFMALPL